MSHVTYECVMSQMNESCHIQMSHVTYEWVMSRMNESCRIWISHVAYKWVVSCMNESCHMCMRHAIYGWVMSHMNAPCYIWMSHVTYACVMAQMNELCHKCQCDFVATIILVYIWFGRLPNCTNGALFVETARWYMRGRDWGHQTKNARRWQWWVKRGRCSAHARLW